MSATAGKSCICCGAGSWATMRTSLPSARSASVIATCEPMASPSGRACDTTTKRRRARMASATWAIVASVEVVVIGRLRLLVELLKNLLDPVLVRDRLVEPELQLRHAPQLHAAADLPPQERRGPIERLLRVLARRRVA